MRPRARRPLTAGVLAAALSLSGVGVASASVWLPPSPVLIAASTVIGQPSVAVAADGRTLLAGDRYDGTNRSAYAAVADGPDLGSPQVLAGSGVVVGGSVDTAVDAQGNETVAWWAGANTVVTAYRPAGQGWQSPQTVAATTSEPRLSAGDGGAAVVVFTANDGSNERVFAATRGAGSTTFSSPTAISPVTAAGGDTIYSNPNVAMDAAGDWIATWQRYYDPDGSGSQPSGYNNEAVAKPVAGVLGTVRQLSLAAQGKSQAVPDVAIDRAGEAVVVWDFIPSGTDERIDYATYAPGSSFASGAFVPGATIASAGGTPYSPSVVVTDDGAATVEFASSLGVQAATRLTAGSGFSSAQVLSGAGANVNDVAMTASSAGVVVVWPALEGDLRKLYAAQRPRGASSFGPAVPAVTRTQPSGGTLSLYFPTVGIDDQGNARLAYVEAANAGSGTTYSLQLATLDAVAPALGAVNVPATATAGTLISVSAAATDRLAAPTFSWAFGDGGTATGATPSHTYAAAGTYTVTLTATDRAGQPTSTTRTVKVAAAVVPAVKATAKLTTAALGNGRTLVKGLTVKGVAKGDKVTLRCKGTGCTKKAKASLKVKKGKVSLSAYVHGLQLAPKAKLTVKVTRPGLAPRVVVFTMVKGKKPKQS